MGPQHGSKSPQDSTSLNEFEAQATPLQCANTASNRQLGEQTYAGDAQDCWVSATIFNAPVDPQILEWLAEERYSVGCKTFASFSLHQDPETIQALNVQDLWKASNVSKNCRNLRKYLMYGYQIPLTIVFRFNPNICRSWNTGDYWRCGRYVYTHHLFTTPPELKTIIIAVVQIFKAFAKSMQTSSAPHPGIHL
ncbi:hypothetical protein B0H14DRAFT_2619010 [Mycena olivaceomarginata]|nr:hypothetical protein B0H14DRAFT_2619010 [Mycena olivaceomarginata]